MCREKKNETFQTKSIRRLESENSPGLCARDTLGEDGAPKTVQGNACLHPPVRRAKRRTDGTSTERDLSDIGGNRCVRPQLGRDGRDASGERVGGWAGERTLAKLSAHVGTVVGGWRGAPSGRASGTHARRKYSVARDEGLNNDPAAATADCSRPFRRKKSVYYVFVLATIARKRFSFLSDDDDDHHHHHHHHHDCITLSVLNIRTGAERC
ncbi:hypothetical protein QTP88_024295 [Uroleucon formosanum]